MWCWLCRYVKCKRLWGMEATPSFQRREQQEMPGSQAQRSGALWDLLWALAPGVLFLWPPHSLPRTAAQPLAAPAVFLLPASAKPHLCLTTLMKFLSARTLSFTPRSWNFEDKKIWVPSHLHLLWFGSRTNLNLLGLGFLVKEVDNLVRMMWTGLDVLILLTRRKPDDGPSVSRSFNFYCSFI